MPRLGRRYPRHGAQSHREMERTGSLGQAHLGCWAQKAEGRRYRQLVYRGVIDVTNSVQDGAQKLESNEEYKVAESKQKDEHDTHLILLQNGIEYQVFHGPTGTDSEFQGHVKDGRSKCVTVGTAVVNNFTGALGTVTENCRGCHEYGGKKINTCL